MKILQIVPSLNIGGVERGTLDLVIAIKEAGHEAHVASNGGLLLARLRRHGCIHHDLPLHSKNPFIMLRNYIRLKRLVETEQIDLIHARSRVPAWIGYFVAKSCSIPFVTTFHGTYNFKNRLKKYYNSIMTKGDKVIAISDFIRQHILTHYKMDEEKIKVIARGVDVEHFSPDRVHGEQLVQLSAKWRLPDDRPIIMLPARLSRWKGHLFLLDALDILNRKMRLAQPAMQETSKPFHCIFVGDDEDSDSYQKTILQKIEDYQFQGMVQFTGKHDDMPIALMLADVVVSASTDPEAFGRVVTEAQAMGRPVVAPAHGGALEQINHGVTGWLYPPEDAEKLAECLYIAINLHQAARAKFALATRENVLNRFSLNQMSRQTIQLYETLHKQEKIGK